METLHQKQMNEQQRKKLLSHVTCVTSSAMLRPSTSVWGSTDTALHTREEEEDEAIHGVVVVVAQRFPILSDAVRPNNRRTGAREESVLQGETQEYTSEAEAIVSNNCFFRNQYRYYYLSIILLSERFLSLSRSFVRASMEIEAAHKVKSQSLSVLSIPFTTKLE